MNNRETTRPLSDIDAETAIIGALVSDPDAIAKVADKIGPDVFTDRRHQFLYTTIYGLWRAGKSFDTVMLRAELAKDGNLTEAGGVEYLGKLHADYVSSAHVQQHAEIIVEKSRLRQIGNAAEEMHGGTAAGHAAADVIDRAIANLERAKAGAASAGKAIAIVRDFSTIKSKPVTWVWPGRIPAGKLSLLVGHPGQGKSLLTLDIAARISTGAGWPNDRTRFEPGSVLLLSGEDDAEDTISPRLKAAGGDLERVSILDGINCRDHGKIKIELPQLDRHISVVSNAVRKMGAKLLIIDPISSFVGTVDDHRNAELRGMLAKLAAMGHDTGCAVLCVSHLRKAGGLAVHQAVGSLAYTAAARAVWCLARDPQSPDRRLLLPIKMNLARDVSGLAFTLESDGGVSDGCPRLRWEEDPVNMTADDVLNPDRRPGPPPLKTEDAQEWLLAALADGPREASELFAEAEADGICKTTLKRAKAELNIQVRKTGFDGGWEWNMPKGLTPST